MIILFVKNEIYVTSTFDLNSSINIPKQKIYWIDVLDEPVHTCDYIDIGNVYAISSRFVVAMRGLSNVD